MLRKKSFGKDRHMLSVRIRLTAIGPVLIQGRRHHVDPIELSPHRLVFLCSWDIPESSRVKLSYELDDSCDRITVAGRLLSKQAWGSRILYTVLLRGTDRDQLRITGMLNRMLHVPDRAFAMYQTRTGTEYAEARAPRPPIVQ
ncbi:hypothetical protein [Paenibacillus sp. DMB20]|uniref:hypothetical protein n=1 Tax=Paenibacillus sp. DMB20 TaxID=1642570 RepID=UPI000627DB41|nr:hypothetical protein [Paenibacillus sp. DMB20]KKO51001.1 hypothetical protein XI25_28715 [Paenibacillus sp. DMB20]